MFVQEWGRFAIGVCAVFLAYPILGQTDRPNVVYIYADDLGYGELGAYGQTKIRTPVLDQLAAEGMRFTQHYAGSVVCSPSRSALLTGEHTGHTFIRNTFFDETGAYELALPAEVVTVAEWMKQAGYVTGAIGKWGLGGPGTTGEPGNQGFDHFFGFLSQSHAHWYYPAYLWRNGVQVLYPENNGIRGPANSGTTHAQDEMTREALDFLDDHAGEPFFLYLAYTAPHISLQPPPHSDPAQAAQGKTAIDEFYADVTWAEPNANGAGDGYHAWAAQPRRAYAALISALDRDVGLILDRLEQLGLTEDTLVIFSSDNGPTPLGGVDVAFFHSTGGLRGLKTELFEGGIRIPMIARWPNRIPGGTVTDHLCAQWDVLPTLAEVAGVPHPSNTDGISFLPTLLGHPEEQAQHPHLYWEYAWGYRAVRLGRWKGLRLEGPAVAGGTFELYDLGADPGETTNLAASNPALVARMNDLMDTSHHLSAPEFFRYWDEFTNYSDVYFLPVELGFQMVSTEFLSPGEFAVVPLPEPVTDDVQFQLKVQMHQGLLKYLTGGLLIGDGPSVNNMVWAGMRGSQSRYSIQRGLQGASLPFPPGTDRLRVFDMAVDYSPSTGLLRLTENGQTLSLTLNPPIPMISHIGYAITDSKTSFSPVVVTLPTNPSVKLTTPCVEVESFHLTYQRPRPGPSVSFQYQSSTDLADWSPCLPSFEQPVDLFGQRQQVEVGFTAPAAQPMFYRVRHLDSTP